MKVRCQRGFSLLELLIVTAFVALIVVIAVPFLKQARDARQGAAQRDERFRSINDLCVKHLEIAFNDKVLDSSKPYAEWISEDEKVVIRPFVAQRLKAICEDAPGELAGYQKAKQEILTAPVDDKHVGMNRRLKLLDDANAHIAYFAAVVTDSGKSCKEATETAKLLDLLP